TRIDIDRAIFKLELARKVKEGCQAEDINGLMFSTIGVSDGMTMSTEGMRYSLPSRDLIADSIKAVIMSFLWSIKYLQSITPPVPGCLMAALCHNRPTILVYGGTIQANIRHVDCPALGYKKGDTVNIADAFESFGAYKPGQISDEERFDVVRHACPGAGACGGMYTANTMSSVLEVLGMSLPYSASIPAVYKLTHGTTKCFDAEADFYPALERGEIKAGQVVIFRYRGPKGSPGMPEVSSTFVIICWGLLDQLWALALVDQPVQSQTVVSPAHPEGLLSVSCLLRQWRPFLKFPKGHVTPEAHLGGPIALVEDGDKITVDAHKRTIDWQVSDEVRAARQTAFASRGPRPFAVKRGVLFRYARDVAVSEFFIHGGKEKLIIFCSPQAQEHIATSAVS
ncbi:unnamed protein product, partial [Rhizoctonia solani]